MNNNLNVIVIPAALCCYVYLHDPYLHALNLYVTCSMPMDPHFYFHLD